jgi:hypothetical protein
MKRLLIILLCLIPIQAFTLDRCERLRQSVRVEHTRYFGADFPYWYGIGQLQQESCCRTNATAFDAGQGVAQFMPKTVQYVNSLMGENLNPYNVKDAIRMQAFYMANLHKQNWSKCLWITYQGYNGGFTLLKKESQRAGITDWNKMKSVCKRKVLHLKWGDLDLCEVNYDYSKKIYKYGQCYKIGVDVKPYW